jgi:putative lipoprotein
VNVRRALALLWLALAPACASPSGPAQVTGSVTYRERIALPEGARLRVTLLDVSMLDMPARVIAEREIRPSGQVPIPFALDFAGDRIEPDRRYALHAELSSPDAKLRWATATAVPVLTQGAPSAVEIVVQRVAAAGSPAGPRVFAYDCDGLAFRAEVAGERALVFLPGRTVALAHVPSASGAKYSDGNVTFWSKGEEASLEVDGAVHAGCRARPRPVP